MKSIHPWHYSPFQALASLISRLHSSLCTALLLHPVIPGSCNASLWTTSAHLVLGFPTGLVVWKFPFRTFFEILSSSILITWPAHSSLLILMSSTMFGSSYRVIWIRKVSLWLLDSLNVFRAKYLIRRQQCVCVCVCVVCVCKCVGCVCGVCVWCVCVCV